MNYRQYFIELGNLAYAISLANGKIHKEESDVFYKMIKSHLKPLKESCDEQGVDNEFLTEFIFNTLKENEVGLEPALDSYMDFVDKNKNIITENLKRVTIEIIEEVAGAYNGIEDSERALIEQVKQKLG